MEFASLLVAIVASLISGLSAWIAYRSTHPRPELHARITTVLHGAAELSTNASGVPVASTVAVVHFRVTNLATAPVQLLDYDLIAVDSQGDQHVLNHERGFALTMYLDWDGEEVTTMTFEPENYISWPPRAVKYGELEMGFLPFVVDESLEVEAIQEYRLTLTDVFDRKYIATLTASELDVWFEGDTTLGLTTILDHAGVAHATQTVEKNAGVPHTPV